MKILVAKDAGYCFGVRDAVKLATESLDTIREIRDAGKEKPEIYELN